MRIAPLLTFCIILVRPVIGGTTPVYEANHGQFPPEVRYVSRGAPVGVAVTGDGLIFKGRGDEFRVRFEHGRPLRCGMGSPVAGTSNYLATVPAIVNVPQYASLSCPEIYQGVDWLLHGNGALLEQDWTIAPNGDVSAIDIRVENALSVNLTPVGEIRMESGTFSMTWKKPVAYQEAGGKREYVPVSYAVSGTHIRLKAGAYDRSRPLIIDPVLDFVNVVAGNGDDQGCALPEPASGPSSAAYQVFVRKLSPDGSKLIYSTYLGRGNFTQRAIGMRVDAGGNVYLAANLCTSALPVAGTPIDSRGSVAVYKLAPAGDRLIYATRVLPNMGYQDPVALTIGAAGEAYVAAGIFNIAVSKIDPSGQKQLFLYSARLGVSSGGIGGAAAGADGSVYLVGTFFGSGLATTPGSWKSAPGDSADYSAFLIRLKPDGSAPVFTTYIPGEFKSSFDVAVDGAGNAYVAGAASGEAQFSGLTPTSLGTSTALKSSGIIVKVKADGSGPLWGAFLPCPRLNAIALDKSGDVFVAGYLDAGLAVAKVNAGGTRLLYYSTVPAAARTSDPGDAKTSWLAIDAAGAAYVAGSSVTVNVPELGAASGPRTNAWFAKVDPDPPQADVAVSVQSDAAAFVPGQTITYTIVAANRGAAPAEDVEVSVDATPLSCRASGQGLCSGSRASFPSIAPGQSESIELQLKMPSLANGDKYVAQVSSRSLTSDTNQDNNATSAVTVANAVTLYVTSELRCSFRFNGGSGLFPSGRYFDVAPDSKVTIEWPSPQITPVGGLAAVFVSWSDGSTENPRTFTPAASDSVVTLSGVFRLFITPLVSSGGIANAGSYASEGFSPGEIVTIFGFNLSGPVATAQVSGGQLTTQLGGTRVLFDGLAAPLLYASGTSVSAIVPYDIAGKASTAVLVQVNGTNSPPVQVPVIDAAPGLFTANASGSGQAAALNQDGSVNSPSNPAVAGQVIVLFGTGEGLVAPLPANGAIVGYPAPAPVLPVTVTIGGLPARVLYAGGAPGEPAGVVQVNAEIPANLPARPDTPVVWNAGSKSSQSGVTIAVN